jgi:hypothetical protein
VWVDYAQRRWALVAGFLVGLAAVYKPNAAIYWPALVAWVWVTTDFARARRFAGLSLCSLLVAPIVAFIWVGWIGALDDAWTALYGYNSAYLALGNQSLAETLYRFAQEVWRRQRSDEVWAIGSLGAAFALAAVARSRTTPSGRIASLGVIWLAAALVAVVANGPRLFTTYFQPPQIPLCLLAAWLLSRVASVRPQLRLTSGLALLVLTGVMFARSGSIARAYRSTSWDLQYIAGGISRETYLDRYRSQTGRAFSAADNARLAEYVSSHTEPSDRIFVFGMSGGTYYSSQRLPASRFVFAYPAVSNMGNRAEYRVETLAANLARVMPRYIILQRSNGDSFSGWKAAEGFKAPPLVAVLQNYRAETEIGDFVLYRRID